MADYKHGDRVRIISGRYTSNCYGTFVDLCGDVSANIKVDHDHVYVRALRMTSFRPISDMDIKKHGRLATHAGCASRSRIPPEPSFGNLERMYGAATTAGGTFSDEDVRKTGAWKSDTTQQYIDDSKKKAVKNEMKRLANCMKELQDRVNKL